MTRQRTLLARATNEEGFTLFYMAVFLVMLLIFVGVAVDTGRAYVVQAQLSKAVDGAALGAARMLNSGNPRQEAATIYRANFPAGWFGTTSSTDPSSSSFYQMTTVPATGLNVVTVSATAVVPTTFMKLANFQEVTVNATGEATRRMVDLSLVIDTSSSIGWRWPYVRDAARSFVNSFDASSDRLSLIFFGNGARVIDAMPAGRGFDKARLVADIPNTLPGGSTAMVQGLFRGWDELRTVPNGQQSGLRVIVLFTDGASNSVPGIWPGSTQSRGYRTWDFPNNGADPDNQTHASPPLDGLYDTTSHTAGANPTIGYPTTTQSSFYPTLNCNTVSPAGCWSSTQVNPRVQWMPVDAFIANARSGGMPNNFPFQSNALTVDGGSQQSRRGLRNFNTTQNRWPADIWNVNNAARNLVEIIANGARGDTTGDYPIRIYAIGMGELVRYNLGTRQEMSEDILKRIANDISSPDRNPAQLEGKYYFAATPDDVGPAFAALQNQIIRLTK
jgi:Flp pilus assembly protein TadG